MPRKEQVLSEAAIEKLIGAGCARNVPAELHYEHRKGAILTGRVRFLTLTDRQILADRPLYLDGEAQIPSGVPITVHVSINGARYQFESMIEEKHLFVQLNSLQRVPGIALQRPSVITDSQRRMDLRVSLMGYDPISIELVRPHPDFPGACSVDGERIAAWLLDLSVGGVSVLADHRVFAQVRPSERFFLTFALPGEDDEFYMLGSVRHSRIVASCDSLRVGLVFVPWRGNAYTSEQHRLSRFVAAHQRRMLCRTR